jgi:ribosomal protein L37AE/L43A
MVRTSQPDRQQTLALDVEPKWDMTCPICGSISRKFSRGPGAVWHCIAADCGQIFQPIVTPPPKPKGGGD